MRKHVLIVQSWLSLSFLATLCHFPVWSNRHFFLIGYDNKKSQNISDIRTAQGMQTFEQSSHAISRAVSRQHRRWELRADRRGWLSEHRISDARVTRCLKSSGVSSQFTLASGRAAISRKPHWQRQLFKSKSFCLHQPLHQQLKPTLARK